MGESDTKTPAVIGRLAPVVEGYFTWPSDEPRLMATRCTSCEHWFFPPSFTCHNPSCSDTTVEAAHLSRRGRLASYTVVHFPPPPPFVPADPFVPFAIGEVAFPEGLQIAGPMTGSDPAALRIGMAVEVVVEPCYENTDGSGVLGWKFRPLEQEAPNT